MTQNTILIGIGFAGCKMLAKAETDLKKLYLDTEQDVIKKYSGIRIGEKVCGKYPAMGDAELAEKAVEESKEDILKQIEDYEKIVILTSLGGGTSGGATTRIAEISTELKKEVVVVCGLPFYFEGRRRTLLAKQAKIELKKFCEVKFFQLDAKQLDNISLKEAFDIYDGMILQLLDTVIK